MKSLTTSLSMKERGISLVVILIFLSILSILAVTAMQSFTLSAKMAGNETDRTLAFQAAEAALRDAEKDLQNLDFNGVSCASPITCRSDPIYLGNGFNATCVNGLCSKISSSGTQYWQTANNFSSSSTKSIAFGAYTGAAALPLVSQQPRYMLEYLQKSDIVGVYRITAVGFGLSSNTQVMLQSIFKSKPS